MIISKNIQAALSNEGKLYGISFGKEIGIVTIENGKIDNLYIEGQYQKNGFGTWLLQYALSVAGKEAYIQVPTSNYWLNKICSRKLKLTEIQRERDFICYVPEDSVWLKQM
jgi:GNAT superfamily N-acetyltransferase